MTDAARRWAYLEAPVDLASAAACRVGYGVLLSFGAARFLVYGWVDRFFVKPSYFFTYWGFEWVHVLPPWAMTASFAVLVVLGLCVALGWRYRLCLMVSWVVFTYVELIDVTNYLNHYYLMSLMGLVLMVVPAHAMWSLDARRRPELRRQTMPRYLLWLLRAQVAAVYINAGLAKLGEDWLIHAQPMNIWMSSRVDTSLVGPLLSHWHTALVMSWAGFLFDTTIVAFLLHPRTRRPAFVVVLIFHALTNVFFNIGLFPLIMITCATLLLDPSWPRRPVAWCRARLGDVGGRSTAPDETSVTPLHQKKYRRVLIIPAIALWATFQLLLPMRGHLYGGDLLWHEQGMRWSWRVMVREKNGSVTYRVRLDDAARTFYVPPSKHLTAHQEREMSGQPDMIVQLGQHIGRQLRARGHAKVEVYVDALVSLNGRPMARLIDPHVDLMTLRPTLAPVTWIEPAPTTAPPKLNPIR